MEKQHLTYFKIENFKRFDFFEMENLGQFNLIVGDNNVGKTSVLEALTFDDKASRLFLNFWGVTNFRGTYEFQNTKLVPDDIRQTRFWESIFKKVKYPIKIDNSSSPFDLFIELRPHTDLSDDEKELVNKAIVTVIPTSWIKVSYVDKEDGKLLNYHLIPAYLEGGNLDNKNDVTGSYIPFIPANIAYKSDLLNIYYLFVNPDKKNRKDTENNLRKFIPNLEEIRPHKISPEQEVIGVTLSNSNTIFPLTYFGDGTVKYFRFLLEIFISQNKRLMVDEIGSGIHFTRLKEYWKTVIQLCSKYNVQLFATTHSLECQRAFVDALEDEEMKQFQADARNITLLENKKGEVKSFTYNFDEFEFSLANGINTRGGER